MANHLYVNQSKCLIAREEVEYLGHVISATGMAADSTKIQSMADWPTPTIHPKLSHHRSIAHTFIEKGWIPLVRDS